MNRFSPSDEELLSRLSWFVRLRWLFLLAVTILILSAIKLFDLKMQLQHIGAVTFVVLIYNVCFLFLHRLRNKAKRKPTAKELRIEANLQIGLDLMALILLIYLSGGIENPFIFFFVFHMIIGSILLTGRDIWFHAAFSVILLFTLLFLSYYEVIRHNHIEGFASPDLWTNIPYIFAGLIAFVTTIGATVYMTDSITKSVRKRENELFDANKQLRRKSQELEIANNELIRQQNLLIQSEKLASIGKLSAGIAHELNSPLTGILNFSHFIRENTSGNDQVQYDVQIVIRETERCKKIIKGLLDFARQSVPEKRENSVITLLNKVIALIRHHKDFKNIEIIEDFDQDIPMIMFDRDQIQQVFMNLIVNAQEAMPQGGTLYIRAQYVTKGDFVEVKFKDAGCGIDAETMGKIFDPFFTTKEMGTGLGLSISLGIIHNHHGELVVESAPNKGATFIVRLPVSAEPVRREVSA